MAQAIIANARRVILVADETKFERTAPVRIGSVAQVDVFVTDRCPRESVRRLCAEAEVELVETASSHGGHAGAEV
ncbi:MAG: glpR 4 [Proteobacteria bacterium]|nr:glpR 4 [Pseudomonadota bacterium]